MTVDLPDEIIELEDEVDYVNVLVHGESGAGKTPFGASSDNTLILRCEQGTTSAKIRGSKAKIWPCDTWIKFKKAKAWLEKAGRTEDGIPFEWVTIDSGTAMQTVLLRHILKTEFKKTPSNRDLDIPQIQDHQKWQNELKRVLQEMVDLPVNLCVTALPMSIESENDEGETDETILPQFLGGKGAIAWAIAGMFDIGGSVRLIKPKGKTEKVQRIYWEKYGPHWGRDRTGALGRYTDNLTLDDLNDRVQKAMKG